MRKRIPAIIPICRRSAGRYLYLSFCIAAVTVSVTRVVAVLFDIELATVVARGGICGCLAALCFILRLRFFIFYLSSIVSNYRVGSARV